MNLADRLLAIHWGLDGAGVGHAFGGAISLAYWTSDPRGTSDIDVNIFTRAEDSQAALDALPDGIESDESSAELIAHEGQIRLPWQGTPIDLFFDYVPLHADAARHRRLVPFAGERIPVLGPVELAVFKAIYARTRDWADIEAMITAETLDLEAVREQLGRMLRGGDPRLERLDEAAQQADGNR